MRARGWVVGVRERARRLAPVAVIALAGSLLAPGSLAQAQPPTTVAGLLGRYYDLSAEAEKANEDLLKVQEDLAAKQAAAADAAKKADDAKATADSARGRAATAREDMDKITALLAGRQSQRGITALVVGTNPDDVLTHVEAADLAGQVSGRVVEFGGAVVAEADQAAAAAAKAADAAKTAANAVAGDEAKAAQHKADLDKQVSDVKGVLDRLTPDERSLLSSSDVNGQDVKVPSGDIGAVLRFALAQLGRPYLWGAVGPAAYDCSGLVQTSFKVAGILLPRVSIEQSGVGQQVLRHEVRAGDLIFFYQPVHHVAIAVDNMRAIHAPSFGETVKISLIDAIGPITVIRRVMN